MLIADQSNKLGLEQQDLKNRNDEYGNPDNLNGGGGNNDDQERS